MDPCTVTQRSQALPLFERATDRLLLLLRVALGVLVLVVVVVVRVFVAVRRQLEADYRPQFEALFSGLLVKHLGAEHLPAVLAALEHEAAQHYLRQAPAVDAALRAAQRRRHEAMTALAQQ